MSALVSIIIPVYNAEKYLAESIQSALNQTWQNKEIIVVDDGSTDNSLAIAKSFGDNIIKVFHQENKGAAAARNYGLREAEGEYIQFLDADDLLSPDKINSQMQLLKESEGYLSSCATIYFHENEDHLNKIKEHPWYSIGTDNPVDFLIKLYSHEENLPGYGGMITVHSWLTPKKLIIKAGYWNEELSVDDDGEFFCRVVLASKGIRYSFEGINYYRKLQDDSLSAQKTHNAYQSLIKAIDLKYQYLKNAGTHSLLNQIMARHYWWIGVASFPQYKDLSSYCIHSAKKLGFRGHKYPGGAAGRIINRFFGWRVARMMSYLKYGT